MSELRVAPFKDGQIIKPSTKKEGWGTAMVIGETVKFNNGIMNVTKRIGFLRAPIAHIEALGLAAGDDLNAKLKSLGSDQVKIVRKESLTPFFEGQEAKKNPKTEAVIKDAQGNPIYMQDSLVGLASGEEDELIQNATATVAAASEAGDDA